MSGNLKLNTTSGGSIALTPENTASTITVTVPAVTATLLNNSTGVMNIGSGQVYKDASGNVGIGTISPLGKFEVDGGRSTLTAISEPYSLGVRYNNTGGRFYIGTASASATPDLVFSRAGGEERMRLTDDGNLLVGTTSVVNSAKLTVNGSIYSSNLSLGSTSTNLLIYEGSTNVLNFRTGAADKFFGMGADGRFTASNGPCAGLGAYIDLSDLASKTNIVSAPYGLYDVLKLNPVMFNFIGTENKEIGFIAQEVQQVIPEVVTQFDDDRLGLQSSNLIAVLVKAIQEQQSLITQLQADVAALKGAA